MAKEFSIEDDMSVRTSVLGGAVLMALAIATSFFLGNVLEARGREGRILAIVIGMSIAMVPDLYYRAARGSGTFVQKFFWMTSGFALRWLPLWVIALTLMGAGIYLSLMLA